MGRPPIRRDAKVKKQTVWMHEDQLARVIALVGSQGLSAFIRRATAAQLEREEAACVASHAEGTAERRQAPALDLKAAIAAIFEDE